MSLSFLWEEVLFQNQLKNQNDNLFLTSYKVDPKSDIIKKKNEPKGVRWNSNDNNINDILANATNSNDYCQRRIMIVEDDQDIARLFAISLQDNGFAVDVFNDPLSALSNYKPGLYDLLLLDIRMPTMNGFELYQKIKDKDEKVKVCFITAFEEALNDFKRLIVLLESPLKSTIL